MSPDWDRMRWVIEPMDITNPITAGVETRFKSTHFNSNNGQKRSR